MHEFSTDVSVISQDRGWKTFFLRGYGFCSDNNIKLCPQTWAAYQKIPGLITVIFSIVERASICRRIADPITECCGYISG